MEHMTDKYVMEVFELSRKVNNEADKIRGFIRFSDNGNYLLAHFEPKRINPLILSASLFTFLESSNTSITYLSVSYTHLEQDDGRAYAN